MNNKFNATTQEFCLAYGTTPKDIYNYIQRGKLEKDKHFTRESHKKLLFNLEAIKETCKYDRFLVGARTQRSKLSKKTLRVTASTLAKKIGLSPKTILNKMYERQSSFNFAIINGLSVPRENCLFSWKEAALFYNNNKTTYREDALKVKILELQRLIKKLPPRLNPIVYSRKTKPLPDNSHMEHALLIDKDKLNELSRVILIGRAAIAEFLGISVRKLGSYKRYKNFPVHKYVYGHKRITLPSAELNKRDQIKTDKMTLHYASRIDLMIWLLGVSEYITSENEMTEKASQILASFSSQHNKQSS